MVELIKRQSKIEKINIGEMLKEFGILPFEVATQISINSWGHLTIRFFKHPAYLKEGELENDIVVVFDSETTKRILDYIKQLKELLG